MPHLAMVVLLLEVVALLETAAPPAQPRAVRPEAPRRPAVAIVVRAFPPLPLAFPLMLALLALLVRLNGVDVPVHAVEVFAREGERPPPLVGRCAARPCALQRRGRVRLRGRCGPDVDGVVRGRRGAR